MNEFLANYYGTAGYGSVESTPANESVEKTAQAELFAKLAADNGVDLNTLSDEQVNQLWSDTFGTEKSAEEAGDKEDGKDDSEDEKKDEAKKELAEKKAAAEKFAEADYLGRVMAHSYVNELNKIAGAKETATSVANKFREVAGKAGKVVGDHMERTGKKVTQKVTGVGTHNMTPSHAKAVGAVTHGMGAAAAGGAAYGVSKAVGDKKEKKASALDDLAFQSALAKIAEMNGDVDVAAARMNAVFTLTGGELPNGTKVAAAGDNVDDAINIRSLEYLEAAGYQVNWE
jgi:hypothetical protein